MHALCVRTRRAGRFVTYAVTMGVSRVTELSRGGGYMLVVILLYSLENSHLYYLRDG